MKKEGDNEAAYFIRIFSKTFSLGLTSDYSWDIIAGMRLLFRCTALLLGLITFAGCWWDPYTLPEPKCQHELNLVPEQVAVTSEESVTFEPQWEACDDSDPRFLDISWQVTFLADDEVQSLYMEGPHFYPPPRSGVYHITASAARTPEAHATVTVSNVATVLVSPTEVSLPPGGVAWFVAKGVGTFNPEHGWHLVDDDSGHITQAGQYTAPDTPGAYHIAAELSWPFHDVPAGLARAEVAGVAIDELEQFVVPHHQVQLTWTVYGASNAVTWALLEDDAGHISASGLYTAPATLGTYTIMAVSADDPTMRDSISVEVRDEWLYTYGDSSKGEARELLPHPQGYVLVGSREVAARDELWIMNTAHDGTPLWAYSLGLEGSRAAALAATQATDGEVVTAGWIEDGGYRQGLLARWLPDGELLWQVAFGAEAHVELRSVAAVTDGTFVVAGTWRSPFHPSDAWVAGIDPAGSVLWQRRIGGSGTDEFNCVAPRPGGGVILAGSTTSWGYGSRNAWRVLLDSPDEITYQVTYGRNEYQSFETCSVDAEGSMLYGGHGEGIVAGRAWVMRFPMHSFQWSSTFSGRTGTTRAVTLDPDGHFIAVAERQTTEGGYYDIILQRLSEDRGGLIGETRFGGHSPRVAYGLLPARHGVVMAGVLDGQPFLAKRHWPPQADPTYPTITGSGLAAESTAVPVATDATTSPASLVRTAVSSVRR